MHSSSQFILITFIALLSSLVGERKWKLIGHKHASEIAFMALDLMASVTNFCIPHRPFEKLKIRVGVNSGSCVAGVVGTSMPRYCLFGRCNFLFLLFNLKGNDSYYFVEFFMKAKHALSELHVFLMNGCSLLLFRQSDIGKVSVITNWSGISS